jgi:murein DD-endopeptidase MepM/ murein hydrolase activator NlpD
MKSWRLWFIMVGLLAGVGVLGLVACQPVAESPLMLGVLPTAVSISYTLPQPTPSIRFTPIPTITPTPLLPPTTTPVPTSTPSPTPTIPAYLLADRTCPEPIPTKPAYVREQIGTNWPTPAATYEPHLWLQKPLPGGGRYVHNITYPYGHDGFGTYLLHNGVDSGAAWGTPVLAVADATVVFARSDEFELHGWRCNWYGNFIVLELTRPWQNQPVYALYAHLDELNVSEGETVVAGQEIGTVGASGVAVQPHLHFEVRVGQNDFDSTRNPMLWVQMPETRGVLAGRLLDPDGRPWQGVPVTATGWVGQNNRHITWTYLDDPRHMINPDEQLGENFVFADLPPGRYKIYARVGDRSYQTEAEVLGGQVTTVELRTREELEITATPTPRVTVIPTATTEPEADE